MSFSLTIPVQVEWRDWDAAVEEAKVDNPPYLTRHCPVARAIWRALHRYLGYNIQDVSVGNKEVVVMMDHDGPTLIGPLPGALAQVVENFDGRRVANHAVLARADLVFSA